MSDDELGLCTLIEEDAVGRFILCSREDGSTGHSEKFYLGDLPIFERLNKNILGDGLTCFPARKSTSTSWEFVVKFKWSAADKNNEAKMLELAKNRDVEGVVRLLNHQEVCNTENLHHGLLIGLPRKLKYIDSDHTDVPDDLKATVGSGLGAALEFTVSTTELNNSGKQKLIENKTFNVLTISPLGRSLHRFDTVPELLGALHDAIQGHQSLYEVGKILHRDLNPSNIIIASNKSKGASHKGILIDFDSAKDLSTGPGSKQYESIETQLFKAIGVLQAYLPENPHTYRHDLESLFYTFLFLATCHRPVPPGENQLQLPSNCTISNWTLGRPFEQANRKMNSMLNDIEFALITSEFTPEFKKLTGLAEELRHLLFPLRDGELWTGTDMTMEGTKALYTDILKAFDKVKDYDCTKLID